jgi:transcriptional regulator of heat shock response
MTLRMTSPTTLEARKAAVLRAVVHDYIRTGEPVGSGTVAASARLGVSSATIRSEMAALEELGYLMQPHTSAGRAPTDLGYRFYVDHLPHRRWLSSPQRQEIEDFFDGAPLEVEELARRAAVLLSRVTRYGAIAEPPHAHHVFVGGVANIAREAAFERRETLTRLFELLEEEETVLRMLRGISSEADVVVRIGRENPVRALREASLVVAPYRVAGKPAGTVAVLGPTRMAYPIAMAAAGAVARRLTGTIEALAG